MPLGLDRHLVACEIFLPVGTHSFPLHPCNDRMSIGWVCTVVCGALVPGKGPLPNDGDVAEGCL